MQFLVQVVVNTCGFSELRVPRVRKFSPNSEATSVHFYFICVYVWYVGACTWVHAPMYAHTENRGGCQMSFLSLSTLLFP